MDNIVDVQALKKFIESNPNIMNQIVGYKKPGVPKGYKKPVTPVIVHTEAENDVEVISHSKAKKMGIIKRKPRNLSPGTKERMLETLAKGREVLKANHAAKRAERESKAKEIVEKEVEKKIKEINLVKDETKPTKKYLVKPVKRRGKRIDDTTDDTTTDAISSEDESLDTTTDEDTKRIQRKVTKKAAVLKTIDKQLSKIPTSTVPVMKSRYGNLF